MKKLTYEQVDNKFVEITKGKNLSTGELIGCLARSLVDSINECIDEPGDYTLKEDEDFQCEYIKFKEDKIVKEGNITFVFSKNEKYFCAFQFGDYTNGSVYVRNDFNKKETFQFSSTDVYLAEEQ